ncbi:MAG TPA: hypothetical protein ENH31_00385 [Nitrospirae bacterium]|nr:hypothetical protein [Nitrospirota bacterium]HDK81009.1 hypothetical protein [Nitrospirota bacterium]
MRKWIEILRTGTFTDSSGNEHTFTEADLDNIVKKYDPSVHEAPEVIGHPKSNSPAWGWVGALKREGDKLFYKAKDRVSEFQQMLDKKMFKKRSAAFYKDWTLKHVGWLGAKPPAVKGLADVAFSEEEDVTIEFEEYRIPIIGRIFQRIRDFLIDKYDIETADNVIRNWEIEDLQREPEEIDQPAAFSGKKTEEEDMDKVKELETQLSEKEAKLKEFAESGTAKDSEIVTLKTDIAGLKAAQRKTDYQSFCETLEKEGKLTPAMKPQVLDFMEVLSDADEHEFSESDGKVKKQPLEVFKTFLNALPKQVEFSETARKDKAAAGDKDREDLISEFMEKNQDATYKEAVLSVSKKHPEKFGSGTE